MTWLTGRGVCVRRTRRSRKTGDGWSFTFADGSVGSVCKEGSMAGCDGKVYTHTALPARYVRYIVYAVCILHGRDVNDPAQSNVKCQINHRITETAC